MDENIKKNIETTINSSIAGIWLEEYTIFDNGISMIYKCENQAFNDIKHMYQCFKRATDITQGRGFNSKTFLKGKEISETLSIMKVLLYE